MYSYHNELRATHPASSPWWAWPLDLKPLWGYLETFVDTTQATVFGAGNPFLLWMSVAAVGFGSSPCVCAWSHTRGPSSRPSMRTEATQNRGCARDEAAVPLGGRRCPLRQGDCSRRKKGRPIRASKRT